MSTLTKRMVVDVPEAMYREIKITCAHKGIPLTRYLLQALLAQLARDQQYQ